ncbi:MAG TPA: ROK family protein [Verrucomicrobiae bacterium]|jgi:glucokinase|nr:ROK family protein [Verrucomicrobiae bacterium]
MKTFLGIEIGGTKLQLVAGDEKMHISERRKLGVEPAAGADGIRRQIEQAIRELGAEWKFDAVGIGFGGPVNWREGKIACSHQIGGWSDFEICRWAEQLTDAPVVVDNDANVAALGEAMHGAGRKFNPVFYVTLGSGVGGGLILDGNIYHGVPPGELEIGHIRMDRVGTILESRCSGWSVNARVRELAKTAPESQLARLAEGAAGHEAKCLGTALRQGDPLAQRLLAEVANDLAFGLSHAVHLLHPEVILLGGGLAGIGESLRFQVAEELQPFLMKVFQPGPQVLLASLGEDAVPIGALELARRKSSGRTDRPATLHDL